MTGVLVRLLSWRYAVECMLFHTMAMWQQWLLTVSMVIDVSVFYFTEETLYKKEPDNY